MRIVHYINQFFGQIGAESEADHPMLVKEGSVGPGKLLEELIGKDATIEATIICGDNYFAEHTEALTDRIAEILQTYQAELLVAGPAFSAGRFGLACGNVCKIAHQIVGIPSVTGMHEENPGLDMFRKYAYIVPTANNARGMKNALADMAILIRKLASGTAIGGPSEENYFPRGIRVPVFREKNGGQRAIEMLLHKVRGEDFATELEMPNFNRVKPSPAIGDLRKAKIAIMTSGGIVPSGNPDKLEACFCTKFKFYPIDRYGGVSLPKAEVAHGGYDPTHANLDANRVLPVDAMAELLEEGAFGALYGEIGVTVGNAMAADQAASFGDAMAKHLLADGVQGVILTST